MFGKLGDWGTNMRVREGNRFAYMSVAFAEDVGMCSCLPPIPDGNKDRQVGRRSDVWSELMQLVGRHAYRPEVPRVGA